MVERMKDQSDENRFADWTSLMFDQAILAEGGQLEDPARFVSRLNDLMFGIA